MDKQTPPPPVLDGCVITDYACTTEAEFRGHSSLFVDGSEVTRVPCLAIGEPMNGDDVLLLHCDDRWTVLGVSGHSSKDEAKTRAERIYRGISTSWIHQEVSTEQVNAYIAEIAQHTCCSFCGRSPDQVSRIVESENARICDVCVRQCNELITAEELEN
ncbi:MAG TPA: ClpX C4-type zinc finger protein [Thermoanaerobaculia bacterium]|jgi:hypothetical protein|nr:ClpX C4-type zinc finger protein [Thermoanaerobaculia bacterium]